MKNDSTDQGTVISVTRRYISVCDREANMHLGKTAKREMEPIVGDLVTFEAKGSSALIQEILPRKNQLRRCYFGREKSLATNLDLLLILAAPSPLWNPIFVDRAFAAARCEGIPVALVLNKSDLEGEALSEVAHVKSYRSMNIPIFEISAKLDHNLEPLISFIQDSQSRMVAFCGVSGVGKSTLLNRLIPDALNKTQTVSQKTGQGRQTTSQSVAYIYPNTTEQTFFIDLPGIQNYGVSHLTIENLLNAFPDLQAYSSACRFSNCTHRAEEECGVKQAVTDGNVSQSRFDSYIQLREEIETSNSFD